MNPLKVIAGGLVVVILILTILLLTRESKEEIQAKALLTYASVQSAIATERQKRILNGDMGEISNLSNGGNGVFTYFNNDKDGNANEVLMYPNESCTDIGCWSGRGDRYVYVDTNGRDVIFSLSDNRLKCVSNCSEFR